MQISVRKLESGAVVPQYSYPGDAGFDICALEEESIAPGERRFVRTGLALAIPEGFVGLVWDKSGRAHTDGLKTMGGVIDAGYRGEIQIGVVNLSTVTVSIAPGEKVAQILVQKIEGVEFVEVESLDESERGERGLGSSGL